ncbi:DegT/DnrJ/EryC1/StrS family aminotransferase [Lysinibacillus parviboronicapiens]|uniref:DegT/DnrJ/EryC1/StrS family aminotransferase n=1 Tax=Lysinibacillus parviboronicapiens TaxID=436516 RepID=UPI0019115055
MSRTCCECYSVDSLIPNCDPNWHLCVIILDDTNIRNSLNHYLEERGIGALIHYPTPLHLQSAFNQYAKLGNLLSTENLCDRILSIPLNVTLMNREQEEIIKSIV